MNQRLEMNKLYITINGTSNDCNIVDCIYYRSFAQNL